VIKLRDSVAFSVVQTVMEFERIDWVSSSFVRLVYVGSTVGNITFVYDFIFHTAYTVDA
jgi:hypothetical protein